MANRLAGETSPYLLQHAENPVDWYPWGAEALEKARREDKPIFLSIGYAACHWCHVMAHESFENPDTAQVMNSFFVNIKVDREERPDLDGIYMDAIVAMTGQGGWPLSAFLTPDGKPFFGGTYFPPERRYNLPSFREILTYIAQTWNSDRTSLIQQADQVLGHLNQTIGQEGSPQPEKVIPNQAMLKLAQNYDWKFGGWGRAPKFPQPQSIEFLLHRATRGDRLALEIAEHALQAMAAGGMYDVVGGGFSRYSTDVRWLVPHFEKMLYDNAQLSAVYLHAYLLTGKPAYRKICEETLVFVERELTSPDGGFYSSLDADSEGEEGKFYVWTIEEIKTILEPAGLTGLYFEAYTISEEGNFEGQNVLQQTTSLDEIAAKAQISPIEAADQLERANVLLRAARASRIRPATDDKILTGWNGLMLLAYAEAGRYLNNKTYLHAATKNARFLLEKMYVGGRLLRSWRDGVAHLDGYLEDYASVILGLLALYQSDGDVQWYAAALMLTEDMLLNFSDPNGGFFDTRHDHETLIVRPKNLQDNATPCGSSMAAMALLQIAAYTGRYEFREKALKLLALVQAAAAQYPTGFGTWLSAIDFSIGPVQEIVVLSNDLNSRRTEDMLTHINQKYRPRSVLSISTFPPEVSAPPLVQNRSLIDDLPTGFVCQNFTCQLPVTDPILLIQQLDMQSQV